MADAVATRVIGETREVYIVHLTNVSDGTGEADVIKVDKSTLLASDGAEPAALDIERVAWNCEGMAVRVEFDHDVDDLVLALSGHGDIDFRGSDAQGGTPSLCSLKDPRTTGGTGDLLVTTVGHTSGDTYNVTLWLRKRSD